MSDSLLVFVSIGYFTLLIDKKYNKVFGAPEQGVVIWRI
jgi:hypothetical protein